MGNTYNVTEKGTIKCACGGTVILKSTVQRHVIAGVKPLLWKDLLGAAISGCPSRSPCTKVVAICSAGTESNVGSGSDSYLLRTDGFKSDKGKAIKLIDPGQHNSKTSATPSLENSVIHPEITPIEKQEIAKEKKTKEKYQLYFLRKSQDEYRPLRPTRAFINATEQYKITDIVETKSIYSHTHAYIYITQDNKTKEYKIFSKGTIYAENLLEITFQDTKHQTITDYIPIYKDSNIEISYSNIKLDSPNDVPKLKKLSFKPNAPDGKDCFYIKNEESLNKHIIEQEQISKAKYKPQVNDYVLKVACIIEDILGEIEDMYEEYHTSFKIAYAHNVGKINEIQKQNIYPYTVAKLSDVFYVDEKENEEYISNITKLRTYYESLVLLFLSTPSIIQTLFAKDADLSWILEKDINNIGSSYVQKIKYLNADFFENEFGNSFKRVVCNKNSFQTSSFAMESFGSRSYIYLANDKDTVYHSSLYLNGGNAKFTTMKNDANLVLANIIFSVIYSENLKDLFDGLGVVKDALLQLANKIYLLLNSATPLPQTTKENIQEVKKVIATQKEAILYPILQRSNDYILEYETLAFQNRENSFTQDAKPLNITSKYLYYDKDFRFFKPENEKDIAKNIFEKIVVKLQDEKLKSLLGIYQRILNTNGFDYVISAMNIVYMLCECRTGLDVEAQKNNIFNPNLSHIYDFMVNLAIKKSLLNENQIVDILLKYQITNAFGELIVQSVMEQIAQKSNLHQKFFNEFKSNTPNEKKDNTYAYNNIYNKENNQEDEVLQKSKEIFEIFKKAEGITSKVQEALEKVYKDMEAVAPERRTISIKNLNRVAGGSNYLKIYSNIIAVGSIYFFFQDKDKTVKSYCEFSKDVTTLITSISQIYKGNFLLKTLEETVNDMVKNASIKNIEPHLRTLLSSNHMEVFSKRLSIVAIIISALYEATTLYEKEDYDASMFVMYIACVEIALIVLNPFLVGVTAGVAFAFVSAYILDKLKDSDIKNYLKKSLLYANVMDYSYNQALQMDFKEDITTRYTAHYLNEVLEKDSPLKKEFKNGFDDSKELIEFIGKNYLDNEILFNTALANELSFLRATLLGYKLELLPKKRDGRISIYGRSVILQLNTFIKISANLFKDKDFKFIFVINNKYISLEEYKSLFKKEQDYYTFNLYHQNFDTLDELKTLDNKQASIIVLSSIVNLKYSFKYEVYVSKDIRLEPVLEANDFRQSSFTVQDTLNLEMFKSKREN